MFKNSGSIFYLWAHQARGSGELHIVFAGFTSVFLRLLGLGINRNSVKKYDFMDPLQLLWIRIWLIINFCNRMLYKFYYIIFAIVNSNYTSKHCFYLFQYAVC